jgi:hypothetical protein
MTNDHRHQNPPATGASITNPSHTSPLTCNFRMALAHWQPVRPW